LPAFEEAVPKERRFIRAALVRSDPLMRSLGRPNREQVVTTRPDVLTTLQALDLSNGQILATQLTRGAATILKANPKLSPDQLIELIYLEALCRRPTAEEMQAARPILGSPATVDGLSDLLWCVFMLPEFQLIQ
jgi:hypothetical protein